MQDELESQIKIMSKKVESIFQIKENDLPLIFDRVDKAEVYIQNIVTFMIKKHCR